MDDKEIEEKEFLTLSIGDKKATASITDNDFPISDPAQIKNITGNTVIEGDNNPIIFKYSLDKKTPYEQIFESIFSTNTESLLTESRLAITGVDTEPGSGFTATDGVTLDLDRTITVPKGNLHSLFLSTSLTIIFLNLMSS